MFTLTEYPDWTVTLLAAPEAITKHLPANDDNIWLSRAMMALLNDRPQGIENSAVILSHEGGREIVMTVQSFTFQPGRQIRQEAPAPKTGRPSGNIRRRLSKFLSFKVLVLGQFMVSGPYGWSNHPENVAVDDLEFGEIISAVSLELARKLGGYSAVLIKDLQPLESVAAVQWREKGFYQLPVDPSMGMAIRSEWKSFEDYLLDMSSKYRVRYRRSRKQLPEELVQRELSLSDCRQYADRLYELYGDVRSEAAFDAVSLEPCYFVSLKKRLGNDLRINGYFQGGQLIGFRTTISNSATLHAHYLGFDQSLNRAHHLYHNMLFDLVEEAIDGCYAHLDFGRTALEIKSSVGAIPAEYFCGIKAINPLMNRLIPLFTPALFRPTRWTQRNPFK